MIDSMVGKLKQFAALLTVLLVLGAAEARPDFVIENVGR